MTRSARRDDHRRGRRGRARQPRRDPPGRRLRAARARPAAGHRPRPRRGRRRPGRRGARRPRGDRAGRCPVGVSPHHLAFAGTVTLSTTTFAALVREYVDSLHRPRLAEVPRDHRPRRQQRHPRHGRRRTCSPPTRDLQFAWTRRSPRSPPTSSPACRQRGARPQRRGRDRADAAPRAAPGAHRPARPRHHHAAELDPLGALSRRAGPPTLTVRYDRLSPNGVLGDPRRATAEDGHASSTPSSRRIVDFVKEWRGDLAGRSATPQTPTVDASTRTEGSVMPARLRTAAWSPRPPQRPARRSRPDCSRSRARAGSDSHLPPRDSARQWPPRLRPAPHAAPPTQAPGTSALHTIYQRRPRPHLPAAPARRTTTDAAPWPLILAFHGRGSTGGEIQGFSGCPRCPPSSPTPTA